jgi:hypothetical protein
MLHSLRASSSSRPIARGLGRDWGSQCNAKRERQCSGKSHFILLGTGSAMELTAPMLTVTDRTRRNDKLFLEQKEKFAAPR